jgi:hypothetical protein
MLKAIVFFYLLPILPGEIAEDVPAAIEQHDKQDGYIPCDSDPAPHNRFKLPEYAPNVKEHNWFVQAQACFIVVAREFLKFTQILHNFILLHVVFVW